MEKRNECTRRILEEHNIMHTVQREEILSLFITEPKHYKADEVFKLLRCKGIGIATVYRTLEMFRKCGVIKEISDGKNRFFEMKKHEEKSVYVHFKCSKCGEIHDYDDVNALNEFAAAVESTEKKMDVSIRDMNILINGLCSKCKE